MMATPIATLAIVLLAIAGPATSARIAAGESATPQTASDVARAMLGPLAAVPDFASFGDAPPAPPKRLTGRGRADAPRAGDPDSKLHPVLFVPGLMGTQMETKLDHRKGAPNWLCSTNTKGYEQVWAPNFMHQLLPYISDCWAETLTLGRWNATGAAFDPIAKGIDTRATPTFAAVMELDNNTIVYGMYAVWLNQYLGYEPGVNMIAQPYDWRCGPETWLSPGREFAQMKSEIERVVDGNGGRGIVALSLSAGGPFFALFLNAYVDESWKEKYVHAFFSISGVMSGSAIAPMSFLSGLHWPNTPGYLMKNLDAILRATSAISWLFPHEDAFSGPVIATPTKNYTASELGDALEAAGYSDQAAMYRMNVAHFGGKALVPGVPTYCLSGYG